MSKTPKVRWLKSFCCCFALAFASGMIPGQPLWIDLLAKQGVGKSFCPDHQETCDTQALAVAGMMSEAQGIGMLNGVFSALLFQSKGGKFIGVLASLVMAVGWLGMAIPCWGAKHGYDSMTAFLVCPVGGLVNFFGRMMMWSMFAFMRFFAGSEAFIMAFANAGHQAGGLQTLMVTGMAEAFGYDFLVVGIFQAAASIACCLIVCVCIPYRGQLGLSNEFSKTSTTDALKQAAKIIQMDCLVHNFVACVLGFGSVWATVYQCSAPHFGQIIFEDPKAGDHLASVVVSFGIVCPILWCFVRKMGLQLFVLAVCLAMWIAACVMGIASWPAQYFVAFTCVSMWGIEPILTGSHLFAYTTIAHAGSVLMIYNNLVIVYTLIAQQCALLYLAAHADTSEGLTEAIRVTLEVGAALYTTYFFFFTFHEKPERPILLPQEEQELCKAFGCTTFQQVVDISSTPESVLIYTLTDNFNEAPHLEMVQRMRPDKLRFYIEKSQLRDLLDFASTQTWFWREKLSERRSSIPLLGFAAMFERRKNRLKASVDVKSCRRGKPKSLKRLQSEMANSKVSIVVDEKDPTKLIRLTEVVLVRLSTIYEGRTYFLVERALYYPGRQTGQKTFRFPGTKKSPTETMEQAVDRIVNELGMEAWEIEMDLEHVEQIEDSKESASYPGLTTLYKKSLVGLSVVEAPNDEMAAAKGLMPKPEAWHTNYSTNILEKAYQTVREEGVQNVQWQWVLSDIVKGMLQNQSVRNKPMEIYNWLTEEEIEKENKKFDIHFPTKKLQTLPASIDEAKTWLLLARANVLQISRLIGKGDVKNLEIFLGRHDVDEVARALRAMPHWSGSTFPEYHDRFCKLISRQKMVDLVSANEAAKVVVIEYIVNDLIATQLRAQQDKGT